MTRQDRFREHSDGVLRQVESPAYPGAFMVQLWHRHGYVILTEQHGVWCGDELGSAAIIRGPQTTQTVWLLERESSNPELKIERYRMFWGEMVEYSVAEGVRKGGRGADGAKEEPKSFDDAKELQAIVRELKASCKEIWERDVRKTDVRTWGEPSGHLQDRSTAAAR